MKKTALLTIDIQNDYFPGGRMELHGSLEASVRAMELLRIFRELKWPVFHIQHLSARPGATFFLPGTEGAELHESIRPLSAEKVVTKHYPNSFRETALLSLLKEAGIEQLVVCGMMTHMCVDATVRAAFDLGFGCIVAHDACATRTLSFDDVEIPAAQVHGAFLAAFVPVYAQVASTSEVAALLR